MKTLYRAIKFNGNVLARIHECNAIVEDYQSQGLRLTLRQIYYQFIARDLFPETWIDRDYNRRKGLDPETKNTIKNYKRLGSILSDGRLAGLIDWDAIEDRTRTPEMTSEWESIDDLVKSAVSAYRLPRWRDQQCYVELWIEKDALAGVFDSIRREYHIALMINRGYSSSSSMHESAQRFLERGAGKHSVLLYLGDHDPSGEDMVRDIGDRLATFGVAVEVIKVALTSKQVKTYKPPPNPAKISDSRAKAYIAKHGHDSWEVDALPPNVMTGLVRAALDAVIDRPAYDKVKKQEARDLAQLRKALVK